MERGRAANVYAFPKRLVNAFVASSDFFRRNSLTHSVTIETASRFDFARSFRTLVVLSAPTARESLRSACLIILIRFPLSIPAPSFSRLAHASVRDQACSGTIVPEQRKKNLINY
jgi:hypothetical protein